MEKSSNTKSASPVDTRAKLIKEATHLFATKGVDGVSVKTIAQAAGVNISLISYHFGGKEGLYRSVLETFGATRLHATEQILQLNNPAQTAEDLRARLQLFFEEFLNAHFENPEIAQIIHRDITKDDIIPKDIFKNTFLKSFHTLVAFLSQAQSSGLLRKDIDPVIVSGLLFGGVVHTARSESINREHFGRSLQEPANRTLFVNQSVLLILEGAISRDSVAKETL